MPGRKTFSFLATVIVGAASMAAAGGAALAQAAKLPEIRLSQRNAVPACVTPERLMAFLRQRNGKLDPRFQNIAHYYKQHGEAWRVRWDYAFFQMAIETNFLTYLRPNGRMGDVDPRQNNFAGIGTTGGGVPGDRFPDVSTGVLGQIQHLVVYSGEAVGEPVAPRTRLKQNHILAKSRELNRAVRFSDLARRWAVDPKYANSIEWVASRYRAQYCQRDGSPSEAEILPWQRAPAQRTSSKGDAASPTVAAVGLPKPKSAAVAPPQETAASATAKRAPENVAALEQTTVQQAAPMAAGMQRLAGAQPGDTQADAGQATVETASVGAPSMFALFVPPAGLLGAVKPDEVAGRELPQPVLGTSSIQPTGSSEASAEPLSDPQTAAGTSVGGFLIAGADATSQKKPPFDPPSGLGVKPGRCVVETATFGGQTTVLVRTRNGADTHYVALSVLDGFEDTMTKSFLSARPEGGEALGTYPSRNEALQQARTLCPETG